MERKGVWTTNIIIMATDMTPVTDYTDSKAEKEQNHSFEVGRTPKSSFGTIRVN